MLSYLVVILPRTDAFNQCTLMKYITENIVNDIHKATILGNFYPWNEVGAGIIKLHYNLKKRSWGQGGICMVSQVTDSERSTFTYKGP